MRQARLAGWHDEIPAFAGMTSWVCGNHANVSVGGRDKTAGYSFSAWVSSQSSPNFS